MADNPVEPAPSPAVRSGHIATYRLLSRLGQHKHGEIHGNTPSAQSHNTTSTMIATMMVLMTVRAWLAFPARRQVRRYGGARTNAGCASVLLARLDAMLLSLVCVLFAVILVF